jgi:hypothetical protein
MTENVTILLLSWGSVLQQQRRPSSTTPSACDRCSSHTPSFIFCKESRLNLALQPTDYYYAVRSVARSRTGTCGAGCPPLPFRVHSVVALVCAVVSRRSELLGEVRRALQFDLSIAAQLHATHHMARMRSCKPQP